MKLGDLYAKNEYVYAANQFGLGVEITGDEDKGVEIWVNMGRISRTQRPVGYGCRGAGRDY